MVVPRLVDVLIAATLLFSTTHKDDKRDQPERCVKRLPNHPRRWINLSAGVSSYKKGKWAAAKEASYKGNLATSPSEASNLQGFSIETKGFAED